MSGRRWSEASAARAMEELSDRDVAILADVARVRVLTGRQVERLHFTELTGSHRDRSRRRVLERLVRLGMLSTLERRIGGVRAGSAGLIYCLSQAGQRWWALQTESYPNRFRAPVTPTERFMIHNLVISELYVALREVERGGGLTLQDFRAEPGAWWTDSEREWIKPDAYLVVTDGDLEDSWAIEADNATESVPTLKRKLMVYLKLATGNEPGPAGAPLPRVLITVPNVKRLSAVEDVIRTLPEPAEALLAVATHDGAVAIITQALREEDIG